ncbi:MAG: 16S rRNA (cytidine(1402)-2'-O)-methyltransferase [Candidatus Glassbacteria bacterium]|nr:16S rRNA (cytidine(1402)-2'-O)-methyltransferase [Candidatus Glassbacteria bacterium]
MKTIQTTPACLFVVGTPLGNLQDITCRAVEVLKTVPVVACEDTRHSRKLLGRYGIKARVISCHEHNEAAAAEKVVSLVESGLPVALISDAGTPGISDPGYRVVSLALERGVRVVPVPGPSAATAALSAAGLPTDSFYFAGFLPARAGPMERALEELSGLKATLVFYCPPHKLIRTLETMLRVLGDRRAAVCREMTKVHEEFLRGRLKELLELVSGRESPLKGEIVLVVEGNAGLEVQTGEELAGRLERYLDSLPEARSLGARKLTLAAAEHLKLPRNKVYPLVCAYLNRG